MDTTNRSVTALRAIALRYPEVREGTSCDKLAFKARDKAFCFIGADRDACNVMVKLRESLPEAARLAAAEPGRYAVGGHGWVKITFPHGEPPPPGLFDRWIEESYRLLAPAKLVAALSHHPAAASAGPIAKSAKRPAAKRRAAR